MQAASRVPTLRERLLATQQVAQANGNVQIPERPEGVIDNYTGNRYYSKADLDRIDELNEQKFNARLDERLKPFEQHQQTQDDQSKESQRVFDQLQEYNETLSGFKDNREIIASEMQKDGRLNALGAYKRVYERDILPKLRSGERETTLKSLQTKAVAQNETRPNKSADSEGRQLHRASQAKKGFQQIFDQISG